MERMKIDLSKIPEVSPLQLLRQIDDCKNGIIERGFLCLIIVGDSFARNIARTSAHQFSNCAKFNRALYLSRPDEIINIPPPKQELIYVDLTGNDENILTNEFIGYACNNKTHENSFIVIVGTGSRIHPKIIENSDLIILDQCNQLLIKQIFLGISQVLAAKHAYFDFGQFKKFSNNDVKIFF